MNRAQPPQVLAATPGGRSLLFHLNEGEGIPRHAHPGARVVIAVLSGTLHVTTGEGTRTLHGAEVVTHDGDRPLALAAAGPGTRVLVTLLGGA
ncbi:cupin domain-containing protein [Deinococcus aestuarii]|uniref:cupin domain-containing protein n=1 Tax=Deinococcus aestuarii TaxID=2774531 RepID=UPI001C0C4E6D|nr:cupin domain-containing protein [Deinococcus aestuarii]